MTPTGELLVDPHAAGFAAALAEAIDEAELAEVAGTIAGENTIFVAARDGITGAELAELFRAPPRGARVTATAGVILGSLPVGERVGIAFSGGLDTCCALAWMRENGRDPVRVHRRPRPVRRAGRRRGPGARAAVRRRGGRARRLPGRARARGARRAPVRRVPHPDRRQALLQHDAARPRRHGDAARRAMAEHGVEIWGDGSTYKGNDIERFYRYGLLANASLRIYKPWLDEAFVSELGGRREMSEWLAERGLPHGAPSRRRTRRTRTCSARRTRRRTSSCSRRR